MTSDAQKLRMVAVSFEHEFDGATAAYRDNPSAENFARLKDAMYAYQYARSATKKSDLIAMYHHHPVARWMPLVITRVKEAMKAANLPY